MKTNYPSACFFVRTSNIMGHCSSTCRVEIEDLSPNNPNFFPLFVTHCGRCAAGKAAVVDGEDALGSVHHVAVVAYSSPLKYGAG